jgi:exodeoxyribonuclease III
MGLSLISYNVNGLRAALRNGLADWLATQNPDILCLQEVKATADVVDLTALEALGYRHHHWHPAQKKGYSGVATFAKTAPDTVINGCGIPVYDAEGRVLRTDFGDLTILNCYFPSGTSGEARQGIKMEFLADFQRFVDTLRQTRPRLIVVGDYNIAHHEIDVHDPVRAKHMTGFLPGERAWLTAWFGSGMTDAFRHAHPHAVEYSWWSYRAGARPNNKGWRIDYISVSDPLRDHIRDCRHLSDAVHADHCPVVLSMSDWRRSD